MIRIRAKSPGGSYGKEKHLSHLSVLLCGRWYYGLLTRIKFLPDNVYQLQVV